ncbi:MAG: response regulator [Planctomycetota bacterium]
MTLQAEAEPDTETQAEMADAGWQCPTILIVDDFAVDRAMARGILNEAMACRIEQASHGEEALELIRKQRPDLVLTDLKMPVMSGLELVSKLNREFPLLPTILMTSFGDEQTAVNVLSAGASSYVPKNHLGDSLARIVRQVLSVSSQTHELHEVLASKAHHAEHFTLESDPRVISPLANHLESQVAVMWKKTGHHSFQLAIALQEALTNAVFHGNLGVSSELRQDGSGTFWEVAEKRRRQSPWAERRLHVNATVTQQEAHFVIRDEGAGFNPSCVASPLDEDNLERLSGRGIFLMRQFMDEVAYSDRGREVTMKLNRRSQRESDELLT